MYGARSSLLLALAGVFTACTAVPIAPATLSASALPGTGEPVEEGADEGGWRWRVTPYLWAADLDGSAKVDGTKVKFDVPFSDTLDNLDEGGELQVEAQVERWSFLVDATYLGLSADGSIAAFPGAKYDVESTLLIGGGGALYQVSEDSPLAVGAGVRYLELRNKVEITGQPTIRDDDDFVDGVVIARNSWLLDDEGAWRLGLYGDVGTGESDLTWQGVATVNRVFEGWALSLGYRYLDYDIGGSTDTNLTFSGFLIGASLVF
jgi:hypothetical protein